MVDEFFSPSSVGRYGQWDVEEDLESDNENNGAGAQEKRLVDQRWEVLVRQRRRQVSGSHLLLCTS